MAGLQLNLLAVQPLWYIDDGFVLLPFFFKALYAYGFAETFFPVDGRDRPWTRLSSVGGGARPAIPLLLSLRLRSEDRGFVSLRSQPMGGYVSVTFLFQKLLPAYSVKALVDAECAMCRAPYAVRMKIKSYVEPTSASRVEEKDMPRHDENACSWKSSNVRPVAPIA